MQLDRDKSGRENNTRENNSSYRGFRLQSMCRSRNACKKEGGNLLDLIMFQTIKQATGTAQRRFKWPDRCYCRRIKGHVCSSVYSVIAPYPRCSILYTMLRSDAIDNVNKERCVLWGSVETQVSTFLHPTSAVHRTTRMYSYTKYF